MKPPQKGGFAQFGKSKGPTFHPLYWTAPDREWLESQYSSPPRGAGKTEEQIAAELGCTRPLIDKWVKALGLSESHSARHSARMRDHKNPAWKGGSRAYHRRWLLRYGPPPVCEWCGTTEKVQVHHRDHDRENGSAENLGWLCGHCNRVEGQLWPLIQGGRATWEFPAGMLIVRFVRAPAIANSEAS